MSGEARPEGLLIRLRPRPGEAAAVQAQIAAWHRGPGRRLPGTRLHLLFDAVGTADELLMVQLFDSARAYERCVASAEHQQWLATLTALLTEPPIADDLFVRWNAASDTRSRVSVSIDRDVHATVQGLIGRLIERHPRTPAEDVYLAMLESIAAEYERDYPATMPEEGDHR